MRLRILSILVSTLCVNIFLFGNVYAAEIPPKPQNFVSDLAEVLNPDEESELNNQLDLIEKETSAEIAVLTITDLEKYDYSVIEDFSFDTFNSWGIGKKDVDNGILIVVSINDRKFRIETGSGSEGAVVDNNARKIAENHFVPNFRNNDYYTGLSLAAKDIAGLIKNDPLLISQYNNQADKKEDFKISDVFVYIIIMGIFIGPQMFIGYLYHTFKDEKKAKKTGILSSILIILLGIFLIGFASLAFFAIFFLLFGGVTLFMAIFGGGSSGGSGGGTPFFFGGGSSSGSSFGGGFGGGFGGFGGGGSSGGGFSGGW